MLGRVLTSLGVFIIVAGTMASSVELAGQASSPSSAGANLPGADAAKTFIAARMAKNWAPPKTPWGDPDIQGIFTTKDEANTPLERPDEWAGRRMEDITPEEFAAAIRKRQQRAVENAPFAAGGEPEGGVAIAVPIHWFDNLAAKNSRPWFVIDPPDGKIPPLTAEAAKRPRALGPGDAQLRGIRDTYTDRYLGDRCIMMGNGVSHTPIIHGNSFQILQTPGYVVIRYEIIHEARVVALDGRQHVSSRIRSYMGDSRGRWDGNTLVVETKNLHETANYRGAPGKSLRLVERFTRIAPNRVEWSMTFDDPTTWERPWTYSLPMTQDDTQIIHEFACHEGNYGMANLLSAGRAAEKRGGESGR